jgi:predicted amidohydrolase
MRAAAVQFAAVPFAGPANLATLEQLVRQAAAQGAQLVVLPELFNTGYAYSPRLTAAAEAPDGPTGRWLQALSAELGICLAGTLLVREGGRPQGQVVNSFVLATPQGARHHYAKRHPFLWEGCYFAAGRTPLIVETALGRLGLLVCWDITHKEAWAEYAGRVDAVLIASTPARFHRALLNFPAARKVHLAELDPGLLHRRHALDELYAGYVGQCAAALGVPVVHAVMAGRFVAALPFPRLSFLANAVRRPAYWAWARQAAQATLRATFYGTSAVYDAAGQALATVPTTEAGLALADVRLGQPPHAPQPVPPAPVPPDLRLFERVLRPLARRAYARNQVLPPVA